MEQRPLTSRYRSVDEDAAAGTDPTMLASIFYGLAMVRKIMESQGGGLSITSTPYHGTAIDLWLPRMAI